MDRSKLIKPYRITNGRRFRLDRHDPAELRGFKHRKRQMAALLDEDLDTLAGLQTRLFASGSWALLLIFQGLDAGGKDGTIRHLIPGISPQGCQVWSFKAPSEEELAHDFLWRSACRLPRRGQVGIFNRSYYEEVLITRLHPEMLERQGLPPGCLSESLWQERFESIRAFESHLSRNGTLILKFFLNISREEQRQRLLARIDDPEKNWKLAASDLAERARWDAYAAAYQEAIAATATEQAPWYVVPADHKPFAHLVVTAAIVEALGELDLAFPPADAARREELAQARKILESEAG